MENTHREGYWGLEFGDYWEAGVETLGIAIGLTEGHTMGMARRLRRSKGPPEGPWERK